VGSVLWLVLGGVAFAEEGVVVVEEEEEEEGVAEDAA
jgi:hypothetical protein